MIQVRRAEDRGVVDAGFFRGVTTFSVAGFVDPKWNGHGALQLLVEDHIVPGGEFPWHNHTGVDIVNVVLEGRLGYRDTDGTIVTLHPGDVACINSGRGIVHSDLNPSATEPEHGYTIWLAGDLSSETRVRVRADTGALGAVQLLASPDGRDGSLSLSGDHDIWQVGLDGQARTLPLRRGADVWLQVLRGSVTTAETTLRAGDGAVLNSAAQLSLGGAGDVLVIDLGER